MSKHIIINVGRQLGSGGRIIGDRLAKDFGIKFYDKELLDLAAKESGFDKRFFERNDEHKGFLKILFSPFAPIFGNSSNPYANQLSDESLFKFQSDAIRKAAERSLDEGMLACIDQTAAYLQQQGETLHPATLAARDEIQNQVRG